MVGNYLGRYLPYNISTALAAVCSKIVTLDLKGDLYKYIINVKILMYYSEWQAILPCFYQDVSKTLKIGSRIELSIKFGAI